MEITRSMIEREDISALLFALRAMTLDAATVRRYAGTIRFMFSGYDEDPRELYSIPEVRRCVQRLTDEFPYWLHYADKDSESLLVVLTCLASVESSAIDLSTNQAGQARSVVDMQGFSLKLQDLFSEMNTLHARHGLSASETSAMTQQVIRYLRQHFKPVPPRSG